MLGHLALNSLSAVVPGAVAKVKKDRPPRCLREASLPISVLLGLTLLLVPFLNLVHLCSVLLALVRVVPSPKVEALAREERVLLTTMVQPPLVAPPILAQTIGNPRSAATTTCVLPPTVLCRLLEPPLLLTVLIVFSARLKLETALRSRVLSMAWLAIMTMSVNIGPPLAPNREVSWHVA